MKQNRISRSARNQECTARLSGYCDPSTVVLAHAPFTGRHGSRQNWIWSAYLCVDCHDRMDNRTMRIYTQAEMRELWYEAINRTQQLLIEQGLIKVIL